MILISMAPCYRKRVVCVPWGVTLRIKIGPTAPTAFYERLAMCPALQKPRDPAMTKLCTCAAYGQGKQAINEIN